MNTIEFAPGMRLPDPMTKLEFAKQLFLCGFLSETGLDVIMDFDAEEAFDDDTKDNETFLSLVLQQHSLDLEEAQDERRFVYSELMSGKSLHQIGQERPARIEKDILDLAVAMVDNEREAA